MFDVPVSVPIYINYIGEVKRFRPSRLPEGMSVPRVDERVYWQGTRGGDGPYRFIVRQVEYNLAGYIEIHVEVV